MWVRGLKRYCRRYYYRRRLSHPMWVRGLKHIQCGIIEHVNKSHPMWVRGLKLAFVEFCHPAAKVAPYVGAWIETLAEGDTQS